jgi:esterase
MQLHFREEGNGTPLIILHGLFGSLDNWASVSRRLAERHRVFSVDQRNHGQSPHSPEMTYPLMADDLRQLVDQLGLAKVHVLGHSMGGKAAMQFACLYRARVDRLIVADIAPRKYPPAHEYIFEALLALDLKSFQTRSQIDQALAPRIPEPATRRFLLKNLAAHSDGPLHWKFDLHSLHRNYRSLNAAPDCNQSFDGPALFVRGGKSDYIRDDDLLEIRGRFPGAEVITIPEAGHWIHAEAPLPFVATMEEFLEK